MIATGRLCDVAPTTPLFLQTWSLFSGTGRINSPAILARDRTGDATRLSNVSFARVLIS